MLITLSSGIKTQHKTQFALQSLTKAVTPAHRMAVPDCPWRLVVTGCMQRPCLAALTPSHAANLWQPRPATWWWWCWCSDLVTLRLHFADVGQLDVGGVGLCRVLGQDAQQGAQFQPPLPQRDAVSAQTGRQQIQASVIFAVIMLQFPHGHTNN